MKRAMFAAIFSVLLLAGNVPFSQAAPKAAPVLRPAITCTSYTWRVEKDSSWQYGGPVDLDAQIWGEHNTQDGTFCGYTKIVVGTKIFVNSLSYQMCGQYKGWDFIQNKWVALDGGCFSESGTYGQVFWAYGTPTYTGDPINVLYCPLDAEASTDQNSNVAYAYIPSAMC